MNTLLSGPARFACMLAIALAWLVLCTAPGIASTKYEQVSAVMKQVFNGGDLGANSPAVKHAADVDMPARGGNPESLKAYLNSQDGTVKSWYRTRFGLSFAQAAPAPAPVPVAPAPNPKYDQVSVVLRQVFNGGDLGPASRAVKHAADVDMPARGGTPETLLAYLKSQDGTARNWYRDNFGLTYASPAPITRPVPAPATVAAPAPAANTVVTPPATAKYDQVSVVLRQVFNGGDLGPASRAVKHAADVDMPARGGTPETLLAYLKSQDGTARNWYRDNFGLTYASPAPITRPVPAPATVAAPAPAANTVVTPPATAKYDQVSVVLRQVFNGGDLGPASRAVKHAADVDMPARGGTPEALRTYLNSQNGTIKNWYRDNFGLSFPAPVAAVPATPAAPVAPPASAQPPAPIALPAQPAPAARPAAVPPLAAAASPASRLPAAPPVVAEAKCTDTRIGESLAAAKRTSEGRSGTSGVCNPIRYRGGQWRDQAHLNLLVTQSYQCDGTAIEQPWIGQAYAELGQPGPRRIRYSNSTSAARFDVDECDLKLYGSPVVNYEDLKAKIVAYKNAPQAPPVLDTAAEAALDVAATNFSRRQEALPSVTGAATAVAEIKAFTENMMQVASAMREDSHFDVLAVRELEAVLRGMRYLADGGPYSLQSLSGGGAVALDMRESEEIDRLLVASGMVEYLKGMNAGLIQAALEVSPHSVSWQPWTAEPEVRLAAMGELPLKLPAFGPGRLTVNMASLDRAQRLVMVLKIANLLRNATLFTGGSAEQEAWLSTRLDVIEQAVGWDKHKLQNGTPGKMPSAQFREFAAAGGKFMKAYGAVKLTNQWLNALSQLAAWLMPNTISTFYAEAGGARTATTYNIHKEQVITLSVYVVPHVTGGTVASPSGIANLVIDSVKVPFLDRIGAGSSAAKKFEDGLKLWVTQFSFALLDKMVGSAAASSGPLAEWAKAQASTYTLPSRNLKQIEINDRRLVNMRVNPARQSQVALDHLGGSFAIMGKNAGNVSVIGYIHNVDLLSHVSGSSNFSMSVTVVDEKPPTAPTPIKPPPGNPIASPVKPTPAQPAPARPTAPAPPAPDVCHRLPNGDWVHSNGSNCSPK